MILVGYRVEPDLALGEFRDLLVRSTLGERRPIDREEVLAGMLANASLIVTARDEDGRLVGVARSVTDFAYCCYLSDLAVDAACQRQGIGAALIEETRARLKPSCSLILLAAPAASAYYPHIGFERHERCWWIPARG